MHLSVIIVAAGSSVRMGFDKLAAPLAGRSTPFFPPSGPATGFSIGLDPKSNFLAISA